MLCIPKLHSCYSDVRYYSNTTYTGISVNIYRFQNENTNKNLKFVTKQPLQINVNKKSHSFQQNLFGDFY